jgi:Na+-transporting NADH:ubiquinone oxidoreductase subunit C
MVEHVTTSGGPWARFCAMSNDSPAKIVIVALTVCLVCSVLVSSASVLLKPFQNENAELAKQREILAVAGLYRKGDDIKARFGAIEQRYVDLLTGEYVGRASGAESTDEISVPPSQDIAGIRSHPRYVRVYLVRDGDRLAKVILPVYGKGLWSTIHGFIALSADGDTVRAITFYDHGETPGLGGEISNPSWSAKWAGKQVGYNNGKPQLRVIKGRVDPAAPDADYEVDGLSGATLTSNGVTNLIQYWLGASGFGPYLRRLRNQGG